MTKGDSVHEGVHMNDFAIVGLACRFPGARNVVEFWRNLGDGLESISFFSDRELVESGVDPALMRHPHYVKARGVLGEVDGFDAHFFGISARGAEIMDPQHRLFLECAWEALESAGYAGGTFPGPVGVY